jgi:large subunit ribosomal protein L22
MEVRASAKHIKMSAKKIRLVIDVVRGLGVNEATDQLKFINKWAAKPVAKLIHSAVANAENNFELDKNNLYIKEIKADEGQTLHRWMPKAHGRATPIRKRTSHIHLMLAEVKDSGERQAKKGKIEAPVKLELRPKEREGIKIEKKQEEKAEDAIEEKGKVIEDIRREGRRGHAPIEGGGHKGFVAKMFRRKSG